ncbi:MAG: L-histidine Nalpha-methyltransferase, partial [Acidimicrobiaceae bacterium]|nr:L-histidine Nalpha-methyltransferase [Acidimicrobiaceae bacterium]
MTVAPVDLDVHVHPDEFGAALRADVLAGLTSMPKTLPPKWFYDDRGSELFEAITRLPEYYPTERERSILRARAASIATHSHADTIVELGSGTSDKTTVLLDAFTATGQLERFVPFDVSEATLREAADRLAARYPAVRVHGVVGDFERHLPFIPREGRRMIVFLGGTIGNFEPAARKAFLATLVATMAPGETFLLGTDLVKDRDRLVRAYDDSAGVTAEFNRNVLRVLNHELDADFEPERFRHRAVWDERNEWIEMHLVSEDERLVHVGALDLKVAFAAGESIRTEISAKFRR